MNTMYEIPETGVYLEAMENVGWCQVIRANTIAEMRKLYKENINYPRRLRVISIGNSTTRSLWEEPIDDFIRRISC